MATPTAPNLSFVSVSGANMVTIVNRKWCPSLLDDLNGMRQRGLFCDVELAVPYGSGGNEGRLSLSAHACVLAASSKLMENILDPQPKTRYVFLKCLSKDSLSACLDYMYGQKICVSCEQVNELMIAAEIFQIDSLKQQCIKAHESIQMLYTGSTATAMTGLGCDADEACPDVTDTEEVEGSQEQGNPAGNTPNLNASVAEIVKKMLMETPDESPKTFKLIIKEPTPGGGTGSEQSTEFRRPGVKLLQSKPTLVSGVMAEEGSHEKVLCDHCGKTFEGQASLKKHKKSVSRKQGPVSDEDRVKKKTSRIKQKTQEYTCPVCKEVFVGYLNFYCHRQEAHSENSDGPGKMYINKLKPVTCDHCNKTFRGLVGLQRHKERVKNNPNFVGKTFDKAEQQRRRRARLLAVKHRAYACQRCGEEFKGWRNYYDHRKKVHEKTYVCRYCSKAFSSPSMLTKHEQRHKREMNFSCSFCRFEAVSKFEVEEHMHRHHLNESYMCSHCPRVLKSKHALRRHEREYHIKGLKRCPYCDYEGLGLYVKRHILNKHFPEQRKTWYCQICSKSFTLKGHLDRHLVKVHQTAPTPRQKYCISRVTNDNSQNEATTMRVGVEADESFLPVRLDAELPGQQQQLQQSGVPHEAMHGEGEVVEEYVAADLLLSHRHGSATGTYHVRGGAQSEEESDMHFVTQVLF